MADLLNKYYASVYTKEDTTEMPAVPVVYLGDKPLRKIEITEEKVKNKIKKLNPSKSQGPDDSTLGLLRNQRQKLLLISVIYSKHQWCKEKQYLIGKSKILHQYSKKAPRMSQVTTGQLV